MRNALESNLTSLLPSFSEAELPLSLVSLASSLLAQSRNTTSALRADEEAARSYACCHIACDRLKITLDLPPIQQRPPLKPQVYKRLYQQLENALPSGSPRASRVRNPSSRLRETQRTPSRVTPGKEASLAQFRSPAGSGPETPTKSARRTPSSVPAKRKAGGSASTLPAWVVPTIQFLSKQLDGERIQRTVLAGMQTIVAPHGRPTKDQWVRDNYAPLLAAIYFLVAANLDSIERGKIDKRRVSRRQSEVVKAMGRVPEAVTRADMDEDELWVGWEDVDFARFEAAVQKVMGSEWVEEEWYTGIHNLVKSNKAAGAGADADPGAAGNDEDEDVVMEDSDERFSAQFHLQKADTMLQSRWVMTDRKREEQRAWQDSMLQRCAEAAAS